MTPLTGADLRSEAYAIDPYPVWRRMREDHPLFHDDIGDRWILSRYTDVTAVLADHGTYSTRTYQERFRPVFGRTLAELDGPRHVRERTIVAPAFVGRSLAGYEPLISARVDRLIGNLESGVPTDLVETVTSRVPLEVIAALLGFPDDDTALLFLLAQDLLEGLEDEPAKRARGAAAHRSLAEHLRPIVASRRDQPEEDLISRIVGAEVEGNRLTDDEIDSFVSFLLVAGGPTTDMAIRNFWWALLTTPGEAERCRLEPERIERAFSESLRRDGPIVYEDRRTNRAVEWYGRTIPEDTDILVCLGSANTDDSVFAEPERFDPDRSDLLPGIERRYGHHDDHTAGHLAFGLGSHFCMGYQLARREVVAATTALLRTFGQIDAVEVVTPRITWYERTVPRLPVVPHH